MIMKTKGTSLIGSPQNTKEGAEMLPLLYSEVDKQPYKLTSINSAPICRICSVICLSRFADGRLCPLIY